MGRIFTYRDDDHSYWEGEPDTGRRLLSTTEICGLAGLVDRTYFTPLAAQKGTYVHLAAEYDDRDDVELDEDDLDEALLPYLEAYRSFKRDCRPEWSMIEARLYDPQLGFAGTVDRVGWLCPRGKTKKQRVVLDLKSGSPAPFHAMQTAGYQHLVTRELVLSGVAEQQPTSKPLVERYGLYLRKNGRYKLTQFTETTDIAVFMAARTVSIWRVKHGFTARVGAPGRNGQH